MAAQSKKVSGSVSTGPVTKTGNPPYPFRTFWAILLLGVNFLVAAIYFHVWNI